jgi:predicted nuclease of predicted toxin-antitoxin system
MARKIRYHLDENCDPRIAAGLTLHGVDVTTTPEAGLLAASDEAQLAFVLAQKRVIVTQDADFLRIAASGGHTVGVVFFPNQERTIGQVIRDLLLIWELLEPSEMQDHIEYL